MDLDFSNLNMDMETEFFSSNNHDVNLLQTSSVYH